MATNNSADADAQNIHKRPFEDPSSINGDQKRVKSEFSQNDPALDNLFAPLPFETKEDFSHSDLPLDTTVNLELPDFLSDKPATNGNPHVSTSTNTPVAPQMSGPGASNVPSSRGAYNPGSNEQQNTNSPAPQLVNNGQGPGQYTPGASNMSRVNSTGKFPEQSQGQPGQINGNPGPSPFYHSQQQSGIAPTYSYQKPNGASFPGQYRPPTNSTVPPPSGFKPGIRFDPKRSFPMHTAIPSPMGTMPGSTMGTSYGTAPNAQDKDKPEDPSKLNDALAVSGVDLQREEELLSTNYNRSALNLHQQQLANRQRQTYGQLNAFLHPYHVALFMNRTARENGVMQNFMVDPEMLEFMSSACKEWLSNIVTKTVALAKHRRRGIPAFNPKNRVAGKQKISPPSQRSEVSKELRNLALKQKELEERRVAKRALLGLEKSDEVAPDSANKAGAEETLHRAANATAAMMTMNPSRKKYSWMTSGAGNSADESKSNGNKDSTSKQSSLISSRGDNGLRYREIRTGNMISSKDLLGVLEDERIGTSKAVVKGYARLKD
ncbi:hypothetical protein JCM33374_g5678 [Metschnikowia sp. JCM 33374]|nr:hypothetical protein JCM33374_g5678 [Metschnikowia sp. JCM 33374]